MNSKQEKKLIYLLYKIKEVLNEEKIEFWLECGTLLGAVRDEKFIPWEHDLDFGAFRVKFPYSLQLLIAKKLSDRGFKVRIFRNFMNISKNERTWADINYYDIINENAIVPHRKAKKFIGNLLIILHSIVLDPNKHRDTYKNVNNLKKNFIIFIENIFILLSHMIPYFLRKQIAKKIYIVYEKIGEKNVYWVVPSHYLTNLSTIEFYGKLFKIPSKVDDYLAYRYGKDWKIPKKDWITERDDGAVSKY